MPGLKTRAGGSGGAMMVHEPAPPVGRCARARGLLLLGLLACISRGAAWGQTVGSQAGAVHAERAQPTAPALPGSPVASSEADSVTARAEAVEKLKEFDTLTGTGGPAHTGPAGSSSSSLPVTAAHPSGPASPTTKASNSAASDKLVPTLLQDRLRWLDDFDATALALRKSTNPEPSPERQASEAKAELSKLTTILNQANTAPEALLPALFREHSPAASGTFAADMKEAIEAANNELKDWQSKLEILRSEMAKWNSLMSARRTDRDSLFERVTVLTAKIEEFKSAVTDAQNATERRLAQERLINFEWQLRVESLRLRLIEAQLALEVKLSEVRELRADVYRVHIKIATKTLEPMQKRYERVIEEEQRKLTRKRTDQEETARTSDDPLERFRASRMAELLALEALVIRNEQDLVISPTPAYDEQKTLADHADYDFANLKELLDDGKVSRLDASRLNNEFRRIGPERDRLMKNEMAMVEAQLQFYEDALTTVELQLLQDSLHERVEHDLLRERLPTERWADGEALLPELERQRWSLVQRRRRALEKLSARASHTLVQVMRRLNILEREYGFIRTNIFWVRDQEPVGLLTLTQGARDFDGLVKGLLRLVKETLNRNRWGQPSGEFLATALAVLILPVAIVRLRRSVGIVNIQSTRTLALGLMRLAIWPLYLVLVAYTARVAPWPRSLGVLVSAVSTGAAIAIFVHDLVHWLTSPAGRPERYLGVPTAVARQLNVGGRFVIVAAILLLLPVYLFDHELIVPEGKPIAAPSLGRLLVLVFELVVWGTCVRHLRGYSPFMDWLSLAPRSAAGNVRAESTESSPPVPTDTSGTLPSVFSVSSWARAVLLWLGRRRSLVAGFALATIAGIIALDVRGYSFTARRLALGVSQSAVAISLASVVYRAIAKVISRNAWRWAQPNRSWAMALTSAMALRATARSRGSVTAPSAEAPAAAEKFERDSDDAALDDLASGLRRLGGYLVAALALFTIAWIWEVDMALVQFLLNRPLWHVDAQTAVTVGDVALTSATILLGILSWRYMSTLFAVTIFKRMPDDPGVRFAVVTLCRYSVLGLSTLIALAALHIDLAKISVILAALGVGLGFGLQEIVSNFVCGIILLLERPIRIGDVVTVAGNTGTVDRINIRATSIVNGDNQIMIVPNREFITGNLVNWTLKDKITRVPIKLTVAYGTDPDRVVNLLLGIARADADVMIKPAPSASLEGFGESSLMFGLSAYVPDPGLAGNVKHRVCAEIQRRFHHEGIIIPYPTHELHVNDSVPREQPRDRPAAPGAALATHPFRSDAAASNIPPVPHAPAAQSSSSREAEQAKSRVESR